MTSWRVRTSMRKPSRNSWGVRTTSSSRSVDRAADHVGDAAGGVRDVGALLEHDDLEIGPAAAGVGGGGHPGGVATDDHQPVCHRAQTTDGSPSAGLFRPVRRESAAVGERAKLRAMAVRQDCRHYSTRTAASGEQVQRCRVDANEKAPVRLPGVLPVLRAPVHHRRRLAALRRERGRLQ